MKKKILFVMLCLLFVGKAFPQINFSLQGYPLNMAGWALGGNATVVDSTIQLTSAGPDEFGNVYYTTPQDISSCAIFNVNFDFRIVESIASPLPADGITFFFFVPPLGSFGTGQAIGLPTPLNGMALLMDTYDNDANGNNPLAAMYGFPSGASYTESNTVNLVGSVFPNQSFIVDGNWHHVVVSYSSGYIKVYFNNSPIPSITGSYSIAGLSGIFGFTSSTGGSFSTQSIKNVYITNSSPIHGIPIACENGTTNLTNDAIGGTWFSDNTSVASVNSSTGVVTGISAGTASIVYTLPAACGSLTANVIVTINAAPGSISGTREICSGAGTQLTDIPGGTWTSSNGNATVNESTGYVNGITAGTSTISYTFVSGCSSSVIITVDPLSIVTPGSIPDICAGTTSASLPFTGVSGNPNSYSIVWDASATTASFANVTDAAIPGSSTITLSVPSLAPATTYTGTLTVNNAYGCVSTAQNLSLTLLPIPVVNAVANQTICNTFLTSGVNFSGTGTTYTWTNSNSTIGLATSGTGNISTFSTTNISNISATAVITVIPTASICNGVAETFSIIVNPTPTVNSVSDQTLCNGMPTTTVTFDGAVSGTNYNWENSNSTIGLATTGIGNIVAFTATNTGAVGSTASITVTPSANSCIGTPHIFTIAVNPTPSVFVPSNQTICNGFNTAMILFAGTIIGTSYTWTNNNSTIGLTTIGTGNISSFSATNTTTVTVIDTITVTPNANSCVGTSQNFTIIVYPTPTIDLVSNQTVCNGLNTAPINYTGAVSGTTYTWSNSNSTIGITTTGTGNISAFASTNLTANPVIDTVIVTPSANGCFGLLDSFTIRVNPTPSVIVPSDQTVCNNFNTSDVIFNGAVSGTTYAWANSNSTIGLATTGVGNISSFTSTNSGTTTVIDTITVTPYANSCTSNSQNFTITVFPTPYVDLVSNQTVCNGINTLPVNYTGAVSGTLYSWTSSNTTIGITATGSGNISAFSATNSTANPVIDTIIVTPSANGCLGLLDSFTIKVNPTPKLTSTLFPADVCNNILFSYLPICTTAGTTFAWKRSLTAGISNGAASGIGNINEILLDTTTYPVTVVYSDTLKANGCINVQSITLTVNPTPKLNSVLTPTAICNNTVFSYNPTSATLGTIFDWKRFAMTGVINGTATGINNPIETLIDTFVNPVLVTYEYDLSFKGCPDTQFVKVEVNPTPNLSTPLHEMTCSGTSFSYNPSSLTYGSSFNWSRAMVAGISNTAVSDTDNINETLIDTTTGSINVTYTYTLGINGCTNTQNLIVTVNPTPSIPSIDTKTPTDVCTNTQFQNFGTATPAQTGEYYTWSAANCNIWNVGTGNQYCLISFPQSGTSIVTLTNTIAATNCKSETSYTVSVNNSESLVPQMIYYNYHFICLEYDADAYYWGYDNASILDSALIPDESNENRYDPNPDFSNKYYWVISTKNGCWQKSYNIVPPTSISSINVTENSIKIYPNPTTELLNIELTGLLKNNMYFRINDLMGKEVMVVPIIDNKIQLSVKSLVSGFYVISCYEGSLKISTSKFIKQ